MEYTPFMVKIGQPTRQFHDALTAPYERQTYTTCEMAWYPDVRIQYHLRYVCTVTPSECVQLDSPGLRRFCSAPILIGR